MRVKGRYLVIGWTTAFLAVAGAIVFRTRQGYETQDRLRALRDSVQAARATRDKVHQSINRLETRQYLAPRLEQLGLRFPSDSEGLRIQIRPDR